MRLMLLSSACLSVAGRFYPPGTFLGTRDQCAPFNGNFENASDDIHIVLSTNEYNVVDASGKYNVPGVPKFTLSDFQKQALDKLFSGLIGCGMSHESIQEPENVIDPTTPNTPRAFKYAPACIKGANDSVTAKLCSNLEKSLILRVSQKACRADPTADAKWSICYMRGYLTDFSPKKGGQARLSRSHDVTAGRLRKLFGFNF